MAKFLVISKTTCYSCVPVRVRIVQDLEIDASDEDNARMLFRLKHRLCPECLGAGTKATVEFDPFMHVENRPSP
jgi:hypothetical protein